MTEWAAGIDLGGTKVALGAVTPEGKILKHWKEATRVEEGPQGVTRQIFSLIEQAEHTLGSAPKAIGVGVAGQVEAKSGKILFAPNLRWHDTPLQRDIEEHTSLPTIVVNDLRAITWGEWKHGAGKGCDDLVCIFVGTGIGGGIVSGGHLLEGVANTAGEIGHVVVHTHGNPCSCGGYGCAEAYAGGWAIAHQAREVASLHIMEGSTLLDLAGGKRNQITAQTVAEAYDLQDDAALEIVHEAAAALGALAINMVNTLSPARIILGGGVLKSIPFLKEAVEKSILYKALEAPRESVEVVSAILEDDAGLVGAAALAYGKSQGEDD